MIATGLRFSFAALSPHIKTRAPAPSLTPGAFPAVILPSCSKTGFNFDSFSKVVSSLGFSSSVIRTFSPLRSCTWTGIISSEKILCLHGSNRSQLTPKCPFILLISAYLQLFRYALPIYTHMAPCKAAC